MIEGCKDLSYENRLTRLNLTTIEERHQRADIIQVYKILNEDAEIYPKDFLSLNNRSGRMNSKKLFKRRCDTNVCINSFTFRVVDIF